MDKYIIYAYTMFWGVIYFTREGGQIPRTWSPTWVGELKNRFFAGKIGRATEKAQGPERLPDALNVIEAQWEY